MKRTEFLKSLGSLAALSLMPKILLPQENRFRPLLGIGKDPFAEPVKPDFIVSSDGKMWLFSGKIEDKVFKIPKGIIVVFTGAIAISGCQFIFEQASPQSFATFDKCSGSLTSCYFDCCNFLFNKEQ